MKSLKLPLTILLVAWMGGVIVVFALVTLSPEGRLYSILPSAMRSLRDLIYPLFYSPSIY
jgi:hypothetical protein